MYPKVLFTICWFFYTFNFKGSTRVLRLILTVIPLKNIAVKHPLGFLWFLDSKESLATYPFIM